MKLVLRGWDIQRRVSTSAQCLSALWLRKIVQLPSKPAPPQQEERVKRLEAALTELVDAQSNDAGEIDRRLAMKDARAALAGDKP